MRGNLFDAYMKNFFKTKVKTFGFQDIVDTIDEEYLMLWVCFKGKRNEKDFVAVCCCGSFCVDVCQLF